MSSVRASGMRADRQPGPKDIDWNNNVRVPAA
jgi:hypothetical protein